MDPRGGVDPDDPDVYPEGHLGAGDPVGMGQEGACPGESALEEVCPGG